MFFAIPTGSKVFSVNGVEEQVNVSDITVTFTPPPCITNVVGKWTVYVIPYLFSTEMYGSKSIAGLTFLSGFDPEKDWVGEQITFYGNPTVVIPEHTITCLLSEYTGNTYRGDMSIPILLFKDYEFSSETVFPSVTYRKWKGDYVSETNMVVYARFILVKQGYN